LKRWLLISDRVDEMKPDFENTFPDYQPKRSPDSILDFMPELAIEIAKLPTAQLDNLLELIQLLKIHQLRAQKKPGYWMEGNVILGANPQEYQPSPDELMVAEIGDRLQAMLNSEPKAEIKKVLLGEKIKVKLLEYTRFTFNHVDVMGSGRFFYVDSFDKITLNFE
jgi:hypothetical protein